MVKHLVLLMVLVLTCIACFSCTAYQGSVRSGENKSLTVGHTLIFGFPVRGVWEFDKSTGKVTKLEVEYK